MRRIHRDYPAAPIAVGGIGGSGTRLIAQILLEVGFFLGEDLNASLDNLWFTLLFKRQEILDLSGPQLAPLLRAFTARMTGASHRPEPCMIRELAATARPPEHPADWLSLRADSLLAPPSRTLPHTRWGWKEPNTHILIHRLMPRLPGMRYVHLMRNGLDMAYSANQNQLRFWGPRFIGSQCEISPYYSLKYWHLSQRRVLDHCIPMGRRFLLLNYDRLCLEPEHGIKRLLDFLEIQAAPALLKRLASMTEPPASVGRFKQHDIGVFDPADIAFVSRLGFDTCSDTK